MNKILISNPFLFPPSGDNEEEKQLFQARAEIIKDYILYSFNEFDKAWREEETRTETPATEGKGTLFPAAISSPTVTSSELGEIEMELEESMLLDINNFDFLENIDSPNFSQDFEKDFSSEQEKKDSNLSEKDRLVYKTNLCLNQIDEASMFSNISQAMSGNFQTAPSDATQQTGSQCGDLTKQASWLDETNFNHLQEFNLLDVAKDDPFPVTQAESMAPENSINIKAASFAVNQATPAAPIKIEPTEYEYTQPPSSRSSNRRKLCPTSRNIHDDSPMLFEEEESMDLNYKPVVDNVDQDIKPLGNLNGVATRTRNLSTTSCSTTVSTKTRKESEQRRKRKYESSNDNDPSVKNAKAAKMNRDKKKKLMYDLQTRNNELTAENQEIKRKFAESQTSAAAFQAEKNEEVRILKKLLGEEKCKNSANSFNTITMIDYMTRMVRTLKPATVELSPQLAEVRVPSISEINEIRRSRMNETGVSTLQSNETYLTVKVGIGGRPSIFFDCENRPHH